MSRKTPLCGSEAVEGGVEEPDGLAEPLVQASDQSRPERGDGAGSPDHGVLAVDADRVAGIRIGVGGDVGHAAADLLARIGRGRNAGVFLVARQRELVADAAAGGAPVRLSFQTTSLDNRRAVGVQRGAAAGQDVGAGGGEVDVGLAVVTPSLDPLSPAATQMVIPRAAAA